MRQFTVYVHKPGKAGPHPAYVVNFAGNDTVAWALDEDWISAVEELEKWLRRNVACQRSPRRAQP
jgi:hypothetical protein